MERFEQHSELLKSVSRSFFLSVKILPQEMREPVALGYLLARFSDTIADNVKLPVAEKLPVLELMGERIAGRNQAVPEFSALTSSLTRDGERQLLASFSVLEQWLDEISDTNQVLVRSVFAKILSGQMGELEHFSVTPAVPMSEDQLLEYTYLVAGCVGEFWTDIGYANLGERFANPEHREMLMHSGKHLGQGLQLVNVIRDQYEDLPAGRAYLPPDAQGGPNTGEWLQTCRKFLVDGKRYPPSINSFRARLATALPLNLALATVDKLEAAGPGKILQEKVKLPRWQVWKLMLKSLH